MKRILVGLFVGVLLGSLLFVGADHFSSKQELVTPPMAPSVAVSKVSGTNYTAFLFTGKGGIAIDPNLLSNELKRAAESEHGSFHILAVPVDKNGTVVVGYGVKFFKDGRIAVKVLRTPASSLSKLSRDIIMKNLDEWVKEKVTFHPDIKAEIKVGMPKGYGGKLLNKNTGKELSMSAEGTSEPYWHDFGPIEDQVIDPPYGNIYMTYHVWGLWNDGNPEREWLAVAGDGTTSLANSYYRTEPGIALRNYFGNTDYKDFKTKEAVISHKWNLDPALKPELGAVNPTTMPGEQTLTLGVGAEGASISYTVVIPDSEIVSYTNGVSPQADWVLKFNTGAACAKSSFSTMVGSVASFDENTLHDGNWHKIVEVDFKVTFQRNYWKYYIIPSTESHDTSMGIVWLLRVG